MSYSSALGSTLIKENVDTIITGAVGYRFTIVLDAPATASGAIYTYPAFVLPQGVWAVLGASRVEASAGTITSTACSLLVNGTSVQSFYTVGNNAVDGVPISGSVVSDGTDTFAITVQSTTSGADTWFSLDTVTANTVYVVRIA